AGRKDELLPQRRSKLPDLHIPAHEHGVLAAGRHVRLQRILREGGAAVVDVSTVVVHLLPVEAAEEIPGHAGEQRRGTVQVALAERPSDRARRVRGHRNRELLRDGDVERTGERRTPDPGAFRGEDRLRARADTGVAGRTAGALVDLLRNRNLDVTENV